MTIKWKINECSVFRYQKEKEREGVGGMERKGKEIEKKEVKNNLGWQKKNSTSNVETYTRKESNEKRNFLLFEEHRKLFSLCC